MKTLIAVIVAASFMLVGGCSDPHANMHCVSSHDEVHSYPVYGHYTVRVRSGRHYVTHTTSYIAYYAHHTYNVCDHWVPNSK